MRLNDVRATTLPESDKTNVQASNDVTEALDVTCLEWALNFMRNYERRQKSALERKHR